MASRIIASGDARPIPHPGIAAARRVDALSTTGPAAFWRLYRAIVDLPDCLAAPDRSARSRIIFFESSSGMRPEQQLERLLAVAWGLDTSCWFERGYAYNLSSARDRLTGDESFVEDEGGDLRLFDIGAGGDGLDAVGPDRIHFARAADVDLFTTPRVAERLQACLVEIERLYAAEPARRVAAAPGGSQSAMRSGIEAFASMVSALHGLPELLRAGFSEGEDDAMICDLSAAAIIVGTAIGGEPSAGFVVGLASFLLHCTDSGLRLETAEQVIEELDECTAANAQRDGGVK